MKRGILSRALASSSQKTYQTGINQYVSFCQHFQTDPLPLSETVVENFCVSLASRVSYKTIKVYLSAVQFWSKMQGGGVLLKDMQRLHYVLLGIRRSQGGNFGRAIRPPVTWVMLQQICAFLVRSETPFDRDMLTAAMLLAYFGLLRVSEYTCPGPAIYDNTVHLSVSDVQVRWDRGFALITIKQSKTDPFREGVQIRISVLGHYLCPVHALVRFLFRRGPSPGPLFIFQNGAFLTRERVSDILVRALPNVPNINTHSFRRGGASALAAAGTPDHVIQVMGRWKSDAFTKYIELPDEFVRSAHGKMGKPKN